MQENKCDVLVVGAGPAGLGAAITSSKRGLKTILVEIPRKQSNTFITTTSQWSRRKDLIKHWQPH